VKARADRRKLVTLWLVDPQESLKAPTAPKGRASRRLVINLLALAALFAAPLYPERAEAFPAELEVIAKVSIGKHPKIIVRASQPALQAVIKLKREDGQVFNFSLGNIDAGMVRELRLDGRGGRHSYEGVMSALVDEERMESPLSFETVVAEPISIQVSRRDLDLEKRRLQIFTNRKVATAELTIIGLNGHPIEQATKQVENWASGVPILLEWKHATREDLMRLEVRVEDADGFFNAISLTPWQVEIPHEEVLFATASAEIAQAEIPKLEESLTRVRDALGRYAEIKGVQLFIAGHTDTRGSSAHNLNLSRRRAHAIAAWFVQSGVTIPVHFAGFGESAPKVKTADEVDEAKNRRVDYLLSVEAPELGRGGWSRLN
jgi:outer membrane protein OmpA-like peptidoglycan-associated protein